ncbi:TonB-dependent receptor domain-containing protein [Microvirga lotononidis]|uniref:Outer membrane receptor for ferrienterochelin and colicins n=1 Tax=Microvirga lotononidis TaxID=864069 RepID=I4YU45_9HYPH|nr:TonB-dependent receptor [Microvirga lotononidis]EIM27487.1 outer membrane receptor for ferrienterochelin and colicins [Microvirga lotononidis]WQO28362.1 TonB-dependent receptor [Microvirga lotononidis]
MAQDVEASAAPGNDDVINLDQIVVTASGFEQTVKNAPASISVITREELERGSFRDLTDALREVQGVVVTGVANEKDMFIRGLPGTYTLILVDGKRQSTRDARTNGNAGFEQSFIPPVTAIDRIEVVRGPMSSLYGSDAMGGVINIITRKVSDNWTTSVTADGTLQQHEYFGNSAQGSFYTSGPLIHRMLGLQLWGRGFGRREDDFLSGITGAREGNIGGRLTFTPTENHDIMLESGFTRIRRDASKWGTLESTANDTYNHNDRKYWSLTHEGRWGPTTSTFSIMQEWAERRSYTENPRTLAFDKNPRSPEIRNTIVDGKFTTPFDFFGTHTLVTGGQWSNASLDDQNPGRRTRIDETFTINQWALFAEDEWRLTDTFSLTNGLRMDHHEIYGAHYSPRSYAVWHATGNLTLKGGLSTGFRAPEIRQIAPGYAYTTGGAGCSYGPNGTCGVILADPNLQAETSTSYEIAALWDNLDGFTASATYFYTDFRDKISNALVLDDAGNPVRWSEDPNYRLWYNYNIDDAVIQGVELAASWRATESISIRGSYTLTDSEQRTGDFAGFPLARTPRHMANARLDWNTPITGLSTWTQVNYHGAEIVGGARIGTNGTPVIINGAAGRRYDAYATMDTGLTYNFTEKLALNAAIYNVFDKEIEPTDHNTVVEGRRLWIGMSATF